MSKFKKLTQIANEKKQFLEDQVGKSQKNKGSLLGDTLKKGVIQMVNK